MGPDDRNEARGDERENGARDASTERRAEMPERRSEGEQQGRVRFSAREIAQVLSHYDLGVISEIREYKRGSRRAAKLKLRAERGEFLLKRRAPGQTARRAEAGHAIQGAAERGGVPVAALVAMRDGRTLLARGERLYELYRWIPGTRYARHEAQARAAGIALARLHAAFLPLASDDRLDLPEGGFSECDAVRVSFDAALAAAEAHPAQERATVRVELASTAAALRAHLDRADRKLAEHGIVRARASVCHGDFHPGNTLWFDDTLAAVIDFDSARREPIAAEIANAMLQFSLRERRGEDPSAWPVGLDPDRLREFATGYFAMPAVDGREIAPTVPWLMISAVIAEAAAPIAREGTFAGIPAAEFLKATQALVEWIAARTRAISGLVAS